jgi:hypothetical protein
MLPRVVWSRVLSHGPGARGAGGHRPPSTRSCRARSRSVPGRRTGRLPPSRTRGRHGRRSRAAEEVCPVRGHGFTLLLLSTSPRMTRRFGAVNIPGPACRSSHRYSVSPRSQMTASSPRGTFSQAELTAETGKPSYSSMTSCRAAAIGESDRRCLCWPVDDDTACRRAALQAAPSRSSTAPT